VDFESSSLALASYFAVGAAGLEAVMRGHLRLGGLTSLVFVVECCGFPKMFGR
jgi:hypothetical protein